MFRELGLFEIPTGPTFNPFRHLDNCCGHLGLTSFRQSAGRADERMVNCKLPYVVDTDVRSSTCVRHFSNGSMVFCKESCSDSRLEDVIHKITALYSYNL